MIGMHGSFKSDKSTLELSVIRTNEDLLRVGISIPGVETFGCIDLPSSNAPALALAILEAAGYTEAEYVDEWPNVNRAVFSLRLGIEEQEREASRAKEQAELEAEALELYNARISFLGGEALTSFEKLNQDNKDMWLAVARKAREMRTEK